MLVVFLDALKKDPTLHPVAYRLLLGQGLGVLDARAGAGCFSNRLRIAYSNLHKPGALLLHNFAWIVMRTCDHVILVLGAMAWFVTIVMGLFGSPLLLFRCRR